MEKKTNQFDIDVYYAFNQMISFIQEDEMGYSFVKDPNIQSRVTGHYGETHLCAALLFLFDRVGKNLYKETALKLLDGILYHWHQDSQHEQSHADFNNFAIALIFKVLIKSCQEKMDQIKDLLLKSSDSRNRTVNWLPMRAYTNLLRYEVSENDKFLEKGIDLLKEVRRAQHDDGLFDDLLPKGRSFNLQYCISTIAIIQLIYSHFPKIKDRLPAFDVAKTMGTLYSLVLPDGDINYMGRGCNQIFAWGPWLYLTNKYINTDIRKTSLSYLHRHFISACKKNNLMLNDYNGSDNCLWWDYHYYTVYMGHFLLWSEIGKMADDSNSKSADNIKKTLPLDSGLNIYRNKYFCAIVFNGRRKYLIEKGPSLVALWTKKHGMIYKCGHSAASKKFSNRYFNPISAYMNHFGVIEIKQKPKRYNNRIIRGLISALQYEENTIELKPKFNEIKIDVNNDLSTITFSVESGETNCSFIFSCFNDEIIDDLKVITGEKQLKLQYICTAPSQYGSMNIYYAQQNNDNGWELKINCL